MAHRNLSRRRFVALGGLGAAGLALPAKGAGPTEQTTSFAVRRQGEGKTLQYFIGIGAGGTPEQVAAVKTLFERFVDTSDTVASVEVLVTPSSEAPRKFQTMVAGGTPPDVLTMGSSQWDFAAKGVFRDIRPLAERDQIDLTEWDDQALQLFTVPTRDNMLYGLPHGLNTMTVMYNKTLLENQGVQLPPKDWNDQSWTWDAFLDKAKGATSGSGGAQTWGVQRLGIGNWLLPWFYGGDWVDEALTTITVAEPPSLEGFQYQYDLIHTHKVMPPPQLSEQMENGFLNGQVGMNIGGTWDIPWLLTAEGFEWDLAPMPWAEGTDLNRRAAPYYPDAFTISSEDNVEESWELIKFLLLDDNNYKEFMNFMGMLPARKPLRDWFVTEFWQKNKPEVSWSVFQDAFNYAQVTRLFFNVNWSEINNTQEADLSTMWLGDTTPGEAVPALQDKLQEIWTRGVEDAQS